ncbi:hypothetical protein [Kitasatospora sp. KL5]|uniref:hypothetical protein n=1 Tax=Kitasatospora sp. KL5 TaxID=3425125 RepID=UPI003D6DAF57
MSARIVRLITHGIRGGWLPWGNMSAGGRHLHHYNIGTLGAVRPTPTPTHPTDRQSSAFRL